jgi:hypothetical protein
MDRRTRHKLPDGRYFVQVAPALFHLHDAFGKFIVELPAEVVSLGGTTKEAEDNDTPRKG